MKEKFKNIIVNILTFLKWLFIVIIHFMLSLFSKEKRKQEMPKLKEIKKEENFNQNKVEKEQLISIPNEDSPRQFSDSVWKLPKDEDDLKKVRIYFIIFLIFSFINITSYIIIDYIKKG